MKNYDLVDVYEISEGSDRYWVCESLFEDDQYDSFAYLSEDIVNAGYEILSVSYVPNPLPVNVYKMLIRWENVNDT